MSNSQFSTCLRGYDLLYDWTFNRETRKSNPQMCAYCTDKMNTLKIRIRLNVCKAIWFIQNKQYACTCKTYAHACMHACMHTHKHACTYTEQLDLVHFEILEVNVKHKEI